MYNNHNTRDETYSDTETHGHKWGDWDAEEEVLAVSPGDFYAATQDIFSQISQRVSNQDLIAWLNGIDDEEQPQNGHLGRAGAYAGFGSSSSGSGDAEMAADAVTAALADLPADRYDFPEPYRDHATYREKLYAFTAEPAAQKFAPHSLGPAPASQSAEIYDEIVDLAQGYDEVELLEHQNEDGDLRGTVHSEVPLNALTGKFDDIDIKSHLQNFYNIGYIGMHPRDRSPTRLDTQRNVYVRTE